MKEYDYMKALWTQFSPEKPEGEELNRMYRRLREGLPKDQRRQLLRLVDAISAHYEMVSLESFVAGFQLAAGIAGETMRSSFSFTEDEEERARILNEP